MAFLYLILIGAYYFAGDAYVAAGNAYLRLPVFLWGVIAKVYDLKFKKRHILLMIIMGALCIYMLHRFGLDFFIRMAWVFFVIPLLTLLSYVFSKLKTPFLTFSGSISLDIYLAHILLINLFAHYGYMQVLGYYSYIVIPTLAYILSVTSKYIIKIYESSSSRRI